MPVLRHAHPCAKVQLTSEATSDIKTDEKDKQVAHLK